jgi:hypothetical protein
LRNPEVVIDGETLTGSEREGKKVKIERMDMAGFSEGNGFAAVPGFASRSAFSGCTGEPPRNVGGSRIALLK